MTEPLIAVFGGTGFLGRRIVERLQHRGARVRIAVRHPERHRRLRPPAKGLEVVRADVQALASVARVLEGCSGAVNAVSLYSERGGATFQSVHVEGARHVARAAAEAGLAHLVHVSGIGADRNAPSDYVRCRGLGEQAVTSAFPPAALVRPSVMFGSDDAFLNTLLRLTRLLPVIPLFGRGETRLQPVHVGDVAEAVARLALGDNHREDLFELGGPDVFTYRELIELILRCTGRRRLLVPVPFAVWSALAQASAPLPKPVLTPAQVSLMKRDNVVDPAAATFAHLGIEPVRLADKLKEYLA